MHSSRLHNNNWLYQLDKSVRFWWVAIGLMREENCVQYSNLTGTHISLIDTLFCSLARYLNLVSYSMHRISAGGAPKELILDTLGVYFLFLDYFSLYYRGSRPVYFMFMYY